MDGRLRRSAVSDQVVGRSGAPSNAQDPHTSLQTLKETPAHLQALRWLAVCVSGGRPVTLRCSALRSLLFQRPILRSTFWRLASSVRYLASVVWCPVSGVWCPLFGVGVLRFYAISELLLCCDPPQPMFNGIRGNIEMGFLELFLDGVH